MLCGLLRVVLVVVFVFSAKIITKKLILLLSPALLIHAFSLYELLGRELSAKFYDYGILGLANLYLCVFALLLSLRRGFV